MSVAPILPRLVPPPVPIIAQRVMLPFTLPSFNEIEAASRRRTVSGSNAYAEWKRTFQPAIVGYIRRARLSPLAPGVYLTFRWFEADKRRDPIDVRPACKIIVDALCAPDRFGDQQARASVIHCDGWHCIAGVADFFAVAETPREARIEVALYGEPAEVRRG